MDRSVRSWARWLWEPRIRQTILFSLIACFLNADQNLIGPNLTEIGESFNMTSSETDLYIGGIISVGFWVIGGITAIAMGYLADTGNRKTLFAVCVFIGEFSCLMTLAVTDYWSFWVTRAVTGMSIGAASPLIYSMIGDLFNDEVRGKVVGFVTIMVSIGAFLGIQVASQVGPVYGWRAPFAVVSVPTLVLSPIFYWFTEDPKRGNAERQLALDETKEYNEKLDIHKLRKLLSTKTVLLLVVQGIPGSVPWGVIYTYFQDFLVHQIGPQVPGGISVSQSSIVVTTFGLGAGLGVIAGGFLADYLWPIRYEYVPLMMSVSTTLGALPIYALVNAPASSLMVYSLVTIPSGFLATLTSASVRTALINVTVPETRGTTFALLTLLDDLGKGLSPLFVAALIEATGSRYTAFNIALGGWFICGAVLFLSVFTVRKDMMILNERLKEASIVSVTPESTTMSVTAKVGFEPDTDFDRYESDGPAADQVIKREASV
jgi:predicted MFS family arabinose efflux permease